MAGRSHYTPEQKAEIVLLGLKNTGKISEICRKHDVSPVSFARWKRQYLTGGLEAMKRKGKLNQDDLERENYKLKTTIGSLYVELEYLKKKLGRGG